ncbi:MAG: hypothetical protein L0Z62_07325 [Gemmataceae bacterium]|nr:hypothetical protein [Gemmataceae bacterium]
MAHLDRDWLLSLPDRIRRWIRANPCKDATGRTNEVETEAYAHLILAFGLARLGEGQIARELHARAREVLSGGDEVHTSLLQAFSHRIRQALEGKPPSGPFPREQLEYLEAMDSIARYKVDRLRQYSRILEPHEEINPYRTWQVRFIDELDQKLATLRDLIDSSELKKTVGSLLEQTRGQSAEERLRRARVVREALGVAPRLEEAFARELLDEVLPACKTLEDAMAKADASEKGNLLMEQAELLAKGIFVAAHFDQVAHAQQLVSRFQTLLGTLHSAGGLHILAWLAGQYLRGLRRLGLRDELRSLLNKVAGVVSGGKPLAELRKQKDREPILRTLLQVASGWYSIGMEGEARPFIEEARTLLYAGELNPREQTKLACVYASTLGQAPLDLARLYIDEMFEKLQRIYDTFTSNTHYSLSRLDVIESVVLAIL